MKIALIIYGQLDTMSGGYLYDRKLVESLRRRGDQVEVISLPPGNYAAHFIDNFRFGLPRGFDLIIEDELNHPSLLSANASEHPCPLVSLVHNLHSLEPRSTWQNNLYRIIERTYLQSVDGFIFNSDTTRAAVLHLMEDRPPFVIASPPSDRFGTPLTGSQIRSRAHEPRPLRLLFLGNVIPLKGLHVLLEVLGDQPSTFCLDVVGSLTVDPRYAEKMKRFVRTHGLSRVVQFHGILDNEPLVERLECAQVMVIPSSYEGFGIAYLEGMGFGLPAMATTAGAASEFIRDGENGYLIPPEDSSALAERLRTLASDRKVLEKMSVNALRSYQSRLSWEQTADRIRGFLQQMIDMKR
ncbi:MAG TPA: glycosyltransferase family 4 protein [Anaerolineales bacterium]|nr:glycosyltransferase family 4 protein [Anaerolineales bacterium]